MVVVGVFGNVCWGEVVRMKIENRTKKGQALKHCTAPHHNTTIENLQCSCMYVCVVWCVDHPHKGSFGSPQILQNHT